MTTSPETTDSLIGHQRELVRLPGESRFQLHRWSTVLLLGTGTLLVAGHYTFGEWVFHPKLTLWRESAFWWDGCKLMTWPASFWLFWMMASLGRIKSAPVIVVAAVTIFLGDWLWYSVWEYIRDSNLKIPPDYWYWWTYWAPAILIGGNLVLVLRWFRLIVFR